ncbi:Uncharacterized protein ALO80_01085 [Pseudomonas caricapapayae]|uniref:Uncharacterized protein n=1 Tax=Pseudomonas caricapapayae TaxID=46678 RepID=A0A0P9KDZ1_9PSED|nr:hypothetical protein [Pseudomonas caricapapayae]KAA8696814.1 hypothetical protein F4W67_06900 [Pseudomonas caricapapayae]KPW53597.1 Uncharacterized protein ALO80_01085 [Pseudomonas caricapapayae]RMM09383.1 hypothetical protein ALQ84_04665 [Pseudomonas caricapapayae]RMV72681.1 hypothetical protein ALP05_02663 [Pseudomonas caricapapayae]RMV94199.1 hypothetical protein ALP01_00403 [Pseudomonas caricapapayae]
MKKTGIGFVAILALLCAFTAQARETQVTDASIVKAIIQESIDSYSGNCPCPYNTARNGSRCGKRSAYSREGGEEPTCYKEDVTKEMINDYRRRLKD